MSTRVVFVVTAALLLGPSSHAADKTIAAKDLPPAVLRALEEATRGATITGYARQDDDGRTRFEVETTVNGNRATCCSIRTAPW